MYTPNSKSTAYSKCLSSSMKLILALLLLLDSDDVKTDTEEE